MDLANGPNPASVWGMRATLSILLLLLASSIAGAQTDPPSSDAPPALSEEQVSQISLGLFGLGDLSI